MTTTSITAMTPSWATIDPEKISAQNPSQLYNLCGGKWCLSKESTSIVDPMNNDEFIKMPNTKASEITPFIESLNSCPKSGLHNPHKNPERYVMWGDVTTKIVMEMRKPEVVDYFVRLIQRVCPKHDAQARAEVLVTRAMLENFCGDQVRFMARGFEVSGNHFGQTSRGLRWPYGPCALIAPFNFPLEIPVLQLMGAVYMGNKVLLKCASMTSSVMEQYIRLMHYCGAPKTDIDLIHCGGAVMGQLIEMAKPRLTQFTGSSVVAEELARITNGKVKIEDAGFDVKIMGPDVQDVEYVAWQCDQDAYALSGQKCSAQSLLIAHENWMKAGLTDKMAAIASERKLSDLSIGPVLSHTTDEILNKHLGAILKIPGSKVLIGGKPLVNHKIPEKYAAIEPTADIAYVAVFVPMKELLKKENFGLCTTEIFGPFQVVTEWKDGEEDQVVMCCERLAHHLTMAICSNDPCFIERMAGMTVNGTTYLGIRARTTGAPQNHWFGPAGDPRGAGIGTIEAIRYVWSCHRELIQDFAVPTGWTRPPPS